MSVRIVTKGRSGNARRKLSPMARLKCGTKETTMSGCVSFQCLSRSLTVGPVVGPDHRLQHAHELGAAERPAGAQHLVVEVLDADVGVFLEDIELVEEFLKVGEPDFPGLPPRLDSHFERRGGRAMAPSGVEENKLDSFHAQGILALQGPKNATGVLKT